MGNWEREQKMKERVGKPQKARRILKEKRRERRRTPPSVRKRERQTRLMKEPHRHREE